MEGNDEDTGSARRSAEVKSSFPGRYSGVLPEVEDDPVVVEAIASLNRVHAKAHKRVSDFTLRAVRVRTPVPPRR